MERSEIRSGTAGSNAERLRFAPSGLRLLGRYFVGASGSHHHFKHPIKPGKVTLPHPRKDLHPKTLKSTYRQAQLQQKR
jgi:predicted RNA binding protein YcfA (HicA-like mRNA interferase family)